MKKTPGQPLKRIPKKLTGTTKQKKGKKVRFILSRDMTEDEMVNAIEKSCKEAGIKFIRDKDRKAKSKIKAKR